MKSSKRQTPFTLNLPPNERYVVAFSGGIDSLALIAFMSEEERKRSAAVYVDHSIRGREELDKEITEGMEIRFVTEMAEVIEQAFVKE